MELEEKEIENAIFEKGTNILKLKTIEKLLDKKFFIPSYQRGYRWDDQQVRDLLPSGK